jgi:phytoene/squalene synthetase
MSSDPTPRQSADAVPEPWVNWVAWELLPDTARVDLAVLFRFVAAVRAVADHPSAGPERKEAALAALAAPFAQGETPAETVAPEAAALAVLLNQRGIDSHLGWQVLQAAGQDLRKTRYRDWSELLTWCRFAAVPVATLASLLLGLSDNEVRRFASLALALQLLEIVRRASSQARWLGRIYLPERWFSEVGADISDLEFLRISDPLRKVRDRALDQADVLLDEASAGGAIHCDGWRLRAAARALLAETRGAVGRERRATEHGTSMILSAFTRRLIKARAVWGGFFGG